jgi:hypothetical protein
MEISFKFSKRDRKELVGFTIYIVVTLCLMHLLGANIV